MRDVTVVNLFLKTLHVHVCHSSWQRKGSLPMCSILLHHHRQSAKAETLIDTVNNILAMKVDMVVMRHPNPVQLCFYRKVNSVIVNAGDGTHEHPTQALLDAFLSIKIREH